MSISAGCFVHNNGTSDSRARLDSRDERWQQRPKGRAVDLIRPVDISERAGQRNTREARQIRLDSREEQITINTKEGLVLMTRLFRGAL